MGKQAGATQGIGRNQEHGALRAGPSTGTDLPQNFGVQDEGEVFAVADDEALPQFFVRQAHAANASAGALAMVNRLRSKPDTSAVRVTGMSRIASS